MLVGASAVGVLQAHRTDAQQDREAIGALGNCAMLTKQKVRCLRSAKTGHFDSSPGAEPSRRRCLGIAAGSRADFSV